MAWLMITDFGRRHSRPTLNISENRRKGPGRVRQRQDRINQQLTSFANWLNSGANRPKTSRQKFR